MIEMEVELVNRLGLHARAAARLAREACRFRSRITLGNRELCANAKSVLGLLALAAPCGTVLQLQVDGEDEEEAVRAITRLVAERFGEAE